jgi:flagellar assembly protein FliH
MSSQHIPKEQLTAWERWELAAFDEAERMTKAMREAKASADRPAPDPVPPEPVPTAPAIDEATLAAIRQSAHDEGRAAGYEQGFAEGRAAGLARGEEAARKECARIEALARSFALSLEAGEGGLADALLQLSLDVAAQILITHLQVKRDLILPTVREAIALLTNAHGHPSLLLHPDDAEIVRQHLGDQLSHSGWRVVEDARIQRGGCRVENAGAEIDATLVTRWRRVVETLGQQTDWLGSQ